MKINEIEEEVMLKRKHSNKPDYKLTKQFKTKTEYVNNPDFKGYVTIFVFEEVEKPLIMHYKEVDYCIADKGYIWLQTLPAGEHYCLTTLIDPQLNIIEWYFDIIKSQGLTSDGIPYFDDIYLDVVLPLDDKAYLLDEDELDDALNNKIITKDEYDAAYKVAHNLLNTIKKEPLTTFSKTYLNYMLEKIND